MFAILAHNLQKMGLSVDDFKSSRLPKSLGMDDIAARSALVPSDINIGNFDNVV